VAEPAGGRRTRVGAVLAVGVLLAAGLSGCSGTKSYCASLKTDQKKLSTLATQAARPGAKGADALGSTVRVLDGLRDQAPDDIRDQWDTVVAALQGVVDAAKATGHPLADFAGGRRPAGVTPGQLQAVRAAAAEMTGTRVQQAGQSIEQHAQDVCKVDLGSGLGGGLAGG